VLSLSDLGKLEGKDKGLAHPQLKELLVGQGRELEGVEFLLKVIKMF
jgi:hypothetical protein